MDWRFVTRAGSRCGAWGIRHCEPLGAAVLAAVGVSNSPRRPWSVPIKLQTTPFCWSIISISVSPCVALCFPLVIYPFSPIESDLIFDGFHVLSTDRRQLSLQIHL